MSEPNPMSVFLKVFGILAILALAIAVVVFALFALSGNRLALRVENPHNWTAPVGASAENPFPPEGSMPLLRADGTPKGYALILYKTPPAYVSVPEGGFTIVVCGNCTVGGKGFVSDGTIGNLIVLMGINADGTTPQDLNTTVVIDGYTTGHVSVTTIWSVNDEDPVAAAMAAVAGMFNAPNCGQEGCLLVNYFVWWPGQEVPSGGETFTEPPAP
jgi:hypothetical protein